MKEYDNDAHLADVISVAGYSTATPYDPRIRVILGTGMKSQVLEVIGLDFDGDYNTLDVYVEHHVP